MDNNPSNQSTTFGSVTGEGGVQNFTINLVGNWLHHTERKEKCYTRQTKLNRFPARFTGLTFLKIAALYYCVLFTVWRLQYYDQQLNSSTSHTAYYYIIVSTFLLFHCLRNENILFPCCCWPESVLLTREASFELDQSAAVKTKIPVMKMLDFCKWCFPNRYVTATCSYGDLAHGIHIAARSFDRVSIWASWC